MSFAGALMGTQLLGSLLTSSSNPQLSLLQGQQPAIQAAQQMQQQSTDISVKAQDDQALAVMQDAAASAQQSAYQSKQQIADQAMAYNNSGVELEGSPLLVLRKSQELAQQSANQILTRAQNQADQIYAGAAITANNGRAQLLGQNIQNQNNIAGAQMQGTQRSLNAIIAAVNGLGATQKPSVIGSNPNSLISGSIPPPSGNIYLTPHGQLPTI